MYVMNPANEFVVDFDQQHLVIPDVRLAGAAIYNIAYLNQDVEWRQRPFALLDLICRQA